MKKLLLIIASIACMGCATAQESVDVSKLTAEQKATLQKTAEQMQGQPANISAVAREETEKWAELGGNMGKAAVGAAKELGIAANEFVGTPLGKVTMAVVIYKVIGKDVIGFFVGGGVLIFFCTVGVILLRTKHYTNAVYEYRPTFFGMYNKRVIVSGNIDEDWAVGYLFAALVAFAIGLITGLNVMF